MLDVLNFGINGKLNAFYSLHKTISSTSYYISVKHNNKFKELSIHVPKKFIFRAFNLSAADFKFSKLREYDVLLSFLKFSKGMAMGKWGLTENEYEELLIGLEMYMIRSYFLGSPVKELLIYTKNWLKLRMARLKGKFKTSD